MATLPANIIEKLPPTKLAYSITGLHDACGIGTSRLHEDAREGRLRTRYLGEGKRKKRIVLREDAVAYLLSLPLGYEVTEEQEAG